MQEGGTASSHKRPAETAGAKALSTDGLKRLGYALVGASFLAPLVTSAAPKLTWFFLLVVSLILIAGAWRSIEWRQAARQNRAFIGVLLLALYILVSTAWAVEPEDALAKAGLLCGVGLLALGACNGAAVWDRLWLRRAGIAFGIGALLGALYVLVEYRTNGATLRWWSSLGLGGGNTAEELKESGTGSLRTHVQMIVIYFWAALAALSLISRKSRRLALIALFIVVAFVPIFISDRESSQFALIASVLFFAFAWLWKTLAPRLLAIVWCLGFVLALPVAFAAYDSGGHLAEWLPPSARARIIIWEYTAERVMESPWLGIGAGSTEAVKRNAHFEQPDGYVYPRGTGPHAHNVFMQAWYELGVVGVLLLAFLGAALALRIPRLPDRAQPFACAAFAAFATSVTFAWSIWQSWLLCAAGLLLLYLFVGAYAPVGPKRP
jgi:O-antigen ligase